MIAIMNTLRYASRLHVYLRYASTLCLAALWLLAFRPLPLCFFALCVYILCLFELCLLRNASLRYASFSSVCVMSICVMPLSYGYLPFASLRDGFLS